VDAGVWEALRAEGEAEVLVVLAAQADLAGTGRLATKEARGRYVYEALRQAAEGSQAGLRAGLEARGAEYRPFYVVNALWVRADEALVAWLAARPEVARIEANPWVLGVAPMDAGDRVTAPGGVEENLIRIHADDVWALGYTGQGAVVGGQDTGYDWDHPALKDAYRGWDGAMASHDYNWHDAIHSGGGVCGADSPEPCDDHNHGTHTMGIMVGDDGVEHQIGVAPGARWIGCRNMDQGVGSPATYLECFDFFLAPYPVGGTPAEGDPALAPDVINNSWSCPPSEGCAADTLEMAVANLRQAGIGVVVSAGNSGSSCETVIYPPAIYQASFSVGAFDHRNDQIANFSSRGPVTYGGQTYTKPNGAAPGVSVYSSVRDGAYWYLSGTSMAAPHVAGVTALLLSAAPGYAGDVDAIEQVLTSTAQPMTSSQGCGGDGPSDVPNNVWGWGIVDALAAVRSLTDGGLQGTVTEMGSGRAIAEAQVMAGIDGQPAFSTTTDVSGTYSLTLPAGTYQLTATATCYTAGLMDGVGVLSATVTVQDFALAAVNCYYLPLMLRGVRLR
jgi:subtilisin family serine protease